MKGMTGKLLRVNLTTGEIRAEEPPEDVYKKYLGGGSLGMYYLFKEGIADPAIKPFDPENMFQIMIGPVTGISPNARSVVVTKSGYNFNTISTSGGRAASELKFAGWDGVQVVGKADKPVYLEIIDDQVTIKDAAHLWGKTAEEAERELIKSTVAPIEYRESIVRDADMPEAYSALHPAARKGIGAKRLASAWVIGPGGENKVWYACVITEGARAHGRWGGGAIMGSKNLKGIVVRGTKGHVVADKAKFLELVQSIQALQAKDYRRRSYGTAGSGARTANVEDAYPIRNWQWCSWSDPTNIKALDGPWMDIASFCKQISCPGCTLHCMYLTEVTSSDPLMDGTITDMPDWEAMGMVGGNLGFLEQEGKTPEDAFTGTHLDLAEALAKTQFATWMHDDNGLDYIEGGNNLALVAELYQRGLITQADIDGIDLKWGDVHAFYELNEKIVHREGVGDKLANGTHETAKYFAELKGKPEILRYAMTAHFYGQPAHDTRSPVDKNALEYVTVNRSCAHTGGGKSGFVSGDYEAAAAAQNSTASINSLVYCSFASGTWAGKTAELVRAATGWEDYTEDNLIECGARQYALTRIFDIHTRQLTDPKEQYDKQVPPRWFEDPLPNGPEKGAVSYEGDPTKLFEEDLPAYWEVRGWTTDKGVPTAETLRALAIDDVAEAIAAQHR